MSRAERAAVGVCVLELSWSGFPAARAHGAPPEFSA
jgi:hypothetical protein